MDTNNGDGHVPKKRKPTLTEEDLKPPEIENAEFLNITTHDGNFGANPIPLCWGAEDPLIRGPVVGTQILYTSNDDC